MPKEHQPDQEDEVFGITDEVASLSALALRLAIL